MPRFLVTVLIQEQEKLVKKTKVYKEATRELVYSKVREEFKVSQFVRETDNKPGIKYINEMEEVKSIDYG